MEPFNTLIQQLKDLWARWSTQQRIGIVAATIACVLLVVGTLYWATSADYVVLAGNLSPQRAAEIVGNLETARIEAELNFSGSAVSVPRSQLAEARLALKDVWDPVTEQDAAGSMAFLNSPAEEESRRTRQLEARIATSITQIRGIRGATVHITMPDYSPFVVEQVPTTASVVIDPVSPTAMTPLVAESIISLVAPAVKGLTRDQIFLTDTSGRSFNVADGMSSAMDTQFEYQRRVEMQLASKAEMMLLPLLGRDKAVVRVTAEIDFRETETFERRIDPDGKVKKQETIENYERKGQIPGGGPAGIEPNIAVANFDTESSGSYKGERIDAMFDSPHTEETTRIAPGMIKRITVAAIVDLTPPAVEPDPDADPDAAVAAAPATVPPDPTQIEAIIRQAVGFNELRGDQIEVMSAPLSSPVPLEAVPAVMATWEQYEPMIRTIGSGVIAFMGFAVALLILRRVKPVVVSDPAPPERQLTLDEVRQLAALSDQAKDNPDVAARVLSAWLGVNDADSESESESAPENTASAA